MYKTIKAKDLKEGMIIAFKDPQQNMFVDEVADTCNGDIKIYCGYSRYDACAVCFYKPEESVYIST